jgi:hypothetical protein
MAGIMTGNDTNHSAFETSCCMRGAIAEGIITAAMKEATLMSALLP